MAHIVRCVLSLVDISLLPPVITRAGNHIRQESRNDASSHGHDKYLFYRGRQRT
jgi:hypothetical protein|tara:strand:+ start:510 stop:671 length:162 start_codon:yes stop_codon:yes gene_type:complete